MTCNFYELVSVQLCLAWAQCILIKVSRLSHVMPYM